MIQLNNMKLPQDCGHCKLEVFDFCVPTDREIEDMASRPSWCPLSEPESGVIVTGVGLYDREEIHENCTVQILSNSVTGEVSVGWWENDGAE